MIYNHWIGTIPWNLVLVGLSGLAVYAASRHGAVSRGLGRTGLVLGGLSVLVAIAPLQYMAGATGGLWILITGVVFFAGDKAFRAGSAAVDGPLIHARCPTHPPPLPARPRPRGRAGSTMSP